MKSVFGQEQLRVPPMNISYLSFVYPLKDTLHSLDKTVDVGKRTRYTIGTCIDKEEKKKFIGFSSLTIYVSCEIRFKYSPSIVTWRETFPTLASIPR